MAQPKTYPEWLKQQGYKLSPDNFAGHRNFLKQLIPLAKDFRQLVHDHGGPWNFPQSKFGSKERKVLDEALRILKRAEVPIALLTREEEDDIILMSSSYDRRKGNQDLD